MKRILHKFRNLLILNYQLEIIILVGFILRIYRLGYHDLWYDEVITLFKLPHLNFLKVWNPPFYFAIIAGWTKIFGFSEFSLRFPSLLFSLACIPVIYLLGKELFNKSAGFYAAAIMAVSPFQLWYAQEARSYSLMLFLALLSGYFQFLFIKRKRNKFLYWCAIFAVLGLYTHPYYIFFAITQLICCITLCGRKWSVRMLVISLLIPLSFIPLLSKSWKRLSVILNGFWVPPVNWKSFLITAENFNLGYNSHLITYLAFDILALIIFIGALQIISKEKSIRRPFAFSLILFLLPIAAAFTFSKLLVSVYIPRGLIICSPYYYLILGLGITAFRKGPIKLVIAGCACLLLIIGIYGFLKDWMPMEYAYHLGVPLKKPLKPAVEFVKKNAKPDDVIAFTEEHIMLPFLWYKDGKTFIFYRRKMLLKKYQFIFSPISLTSSYKKPRKENRFNIPLRKINTLEFDKLWVISGVWARDGNLDINSQIVKKHLDKNFILEQEREFDGIWIYQYTR